MTALLLQTFLLMLLPFFAGAALACGLRKMRHQSKAAAVMAPESRMGSVAFDAPAANQPVARVAAQVPNLAPNLAQPSKPAVAVAPSVTAPAVQAATTAAARTAEPANRFDETLRARPPEPARPAPPPPAAIITPKAAEAVIVSAPPPSSPRIAAERPAVTSAAPVAAKPAEVSTLSKIEMAASAAVAVAAATAVLKAQAASASAPAVVAPVSAAPVPASSAAAVAPVAVTPMQTLPVAPAAMAPMVAPTAASASAIVVPPTRETVVPASRVGAGGDDLTRISAIDPTLSDKLGKLGITRFSQVAAWRKGDVDQMSKTLGFQDRIEQENWIEQAQILTTGSETHYSSQRARVTNAMAAAPDVRGGQTGMPVTLDLPQTPATTAPVTAPAAPVAAAVPAKVAETVTAVLPPKVEERAAFASTPAKAAPAIIADAPALASVGAKEASSSAAIATAAAAAAATALATSRPATAVAAIALEPTPPAASIVMGSGAAAPADTAVKAAATVDAPAAAVAIRPAMAPDRDALQRIGSINGEIERLLAVQNVTRYSQIAGWGASDVEKFDRLLGSQGRIGREGWVEQAQILAKGGDTTHSRDFDRRVADAKSDAPIRPKSIAEAIRVTAAAAEVTPVAPTPKTADISALRSVRSDAYKTAMSAVVASAAATEAASGGAKVVRSAEADDLKRIRGVGVLIEKRLNAEGIVSYDQIADWTTDDIDRVSAKLDFKGRIEREHWVEQARILSAGGHTEFSRRLDRGDVETPRPKG